MVRDKDVRRVIAASVAVVFGNKVVLFCFDAGMIPVGEPNMTALWVSGFGGGYRARYMSCRI